MYIDEGKVIADLSAPSPKKFSMCSTGNAVLVFTSYTPVRV